jgi:hypothetical protein
MSRIVTRRHESSMTLINTIANDVKALQRRTLDSERCGSFCTMLETAIYSGEVDWLPGDWMEALAWALHDPATQQEASDG